MKTNLRLASLLAASSLAVLPAFGAPGDVVFRNVQTSISVALAPTPDAPIGASGSAEIKVHQVNAFQAAAVRLTVGGLAAGHYKIVATLANASVVTIGGFRATAAGIPAEVGKADGTIVRIIPAAVDATKIVSLAIVDANATAILEGSASVDATIVNFFANVRVTGPGSTAFPPLGVHGHAFAHSKSSNGAETQRLFYWIAFGAPPSTQLTINVDGNVVGTTVSSAQGEVILNSLPAGIDLTTMKVVTLTDATNTVIMQAQF